MTKQSLESTRQLVQTSRLVFNRWNPNVLSGEKREALKADMKQNGVLGIEPIKVVPAHNIYPDQPNDALIILDGAQRAGLALELKWPEIWVDVEYSVVDEVSAMLYTWRKLYERGSIDGFKEAQFYKSLVDKGLTQKQIAERFGVDQSTVSKRLGLLTLPESVRALMSKADKLSLRHVEPVLGLPEADQVEILRDAVKYGDSTRDVEERARSVKQDLERQKKFEEIVSKAKFKVCPMEGCGKPAVIGWGNPNVLSLQCSSGNWQHEWDGNTGKTRSQRMAKERAAQMKADLERKGLSKKLPDYVNSERSVEEWRTAMVSYVLSELLPKIKSLEDIEIRGEFEVDGKTRVLEVNLNEAWEGVGWSLEVNDGKTYKSVVDLTVTQVEYKAKHLAQYKSQVGVPSPDSEKQLADAEKSANLFFETYASKPTKKTPQARKSELSREVHAALDKLEAEVPLAGGK